MVAVGLVACDSSGTADPPLSPNVLDPGASWTYDARLIQPPLDSADVDTVNVAQVRAEVAAAGVELGGRSGLVQLDVFEPSAPEKVNRSWYQQSPDSLVDVAHSFDGYSGISFFSNLKNDNTANLGRGLTGPPLLVQDRLQKRGGRARDPAADTTVRDDSRLVLKAPLEQGNSWTALRDSFLNTRTVVGDTSIATPAGRFDAVEVKTTHRSGEDTFEWSDFYSKVGLVKRVLTDTLEGRDPDGTQIGLVFYQEVHTLTDHQD